ncbi:MAG: hypothetical protein IKF82_03650 [Bacilli bacterium]|nr:hypothetical protein [Bacilli bacterium]
MTYVNTKPVICEATGIDDNGEYTYTEFGTSQEKKEIKDDIDGYDIYAPYEHIMLVPILDPRYESVQYSDVDGYELVDVIYYDKIKSSKYSLPEVKLKGSWALYTNNVTVKRQISDDEFIEFGVPVE